MRSERAATVFVFVVVLASHLVYAYCSNGDYFFPDSNDYFTAARNVLNGDGFTYEGTPETFRTPGYPMFLLPFLALHAPAWTIVFTQHLLYALLAIAIFRWTRSITAALVLGIDVMSIHYANKVLTETLSTVFAFVIVWIVLKRRSTPWLVAAGLLCGTLVLIRPVAIVYFCVVMLWLAYMREARRTIIAFAIAAIVLPAGWAMRNQVETGHFTISAVGAVNLLEYRASGAMAMEEPGDFKERRQAHMDELLRIVRERIREGEEDDPDNVNSADCAPYYSALARQVLLQHPRGTILMTVRGFFVNMFDADWPALGVVSSLPGPFIRIVMNVWTWMLWIAAIAGLAMMWRRDRAAALLIGATIFYFIFMAAGGESEGRFRIPVIPLMAVAVTSLFRSPLRYSTSRPTSSRASGQTESR
ncbi:MAG TPA: hypothetical protein VLU46_00800 [Thermoanaerobaculia bacterium]|nr:hypothetical protein [Thermoanaerobaculia bacterium]